MKTLEQTKSWFKSAKFGMMVHFGLYSILGGEYKGVRPEPNAEWIRSKCRIPGDEYVKLAETPATLGTSWGFKYFDNNIKTADEVLRLKEHLNSRGVNYLLNVGPDGLGRIPKSSVDVLRELAERNGK